MPSIDGSGSITVIAVTFQLSEDGSTTELITAATEKLSEIATPGTITTTGALDFAALIDHVQTTPLFQYTGSLTTPPCAEGLTFLVTQQPLPLNVVAFNAMKSVIKFNSRFTQNKLGEENLLVVGAGTLGCNTSGGGDDVEDVSSTTAAAETKTTKTPATTSSLVAHPVPTTTCTRKAVVTPSPATRHPKGITRPVSTPTATQRRDTYSQFLSRSSRFADRSPTAVSSPLVLECSK